MPYRSSSFLAAFLLSFATASAHAQPAATGSAHAQSAATASAPAQSAPTPTDAASATASATQGPTVESAAPTTQLTRRQRRSPHEQRDHAYWFLGASFQESFVPVGVLKLFLRNAPTGVHIPHAQLELTHRRNNFEIVTSLYWASYSFTGPFLAKGNADTKTEMIQSNAQAFGASATMLWSTPFNDVVALEYGLLVGLGGLVGNVTRTEAYPSTGGPNTRNGYAGCVTPSSPGQPGSAHATDPFNQASGSTVAAYCGAPSNGGYSDGDTNSGEQYGVHARSWAHGGSKPFLSARLAPQLSLRIKPIDHFVMRIDAGFDFFSGVYVGGALAYGF